MHYEHPGRMGTRKYLRENFLVAFMWRRPLNGTALAIPTHRGPKRISNATSPQVVVWMINKWRAKIIEREIYNVRGPWQRDDGKFVGENTVTIWTIFVNIYNQNILEHSSLDYAEDQFTLRNLVHFYVIHFLKFHSNYCPIH